MPTPANQREVSFAVKGDRCAATLYLPPIPGPARPPVIVMAHGLGAVRAMRLPTYAERFTEAGYACLVFDYRHFGDSEGQPRQLLSPRKQCADWLAAVAFARTLPEVDGDRVVAWGTSFGGGNAIMTAAARPPGLVAAIAQCPFTDGVESTLVLNPVTSAKVTLAAVGDVVGKLFGHAPRMIATAGPARSAALMTAPDAEPGYLALVPPDLDFDNEVAARAVFDILRYRPGRRAVQIEMPILFAVCQNDSVAPAGPTLKYARRAPRGEICTYVEGHFEIYLGDAFERAVADQVDFLDRHVPIED